METEHTQIQIIKLKLLGWYVRGNDLLWMGSDVYNLKKQKNFSDIEAKLACMQLLPIF